MRRRQPRNNKKTIVNNDKKIKIIIPVAIIILFILFFSTIFSLSNSGNNKIIKGVKIDDIDVSNLSIDEAKELINENKNNIINSEIKLKYNDLEKKIKLSDLNIDINIDDSLDQAIKIGKFRNIIKDNYSILGTLLFGKKIKSQIIIDEEIINKNIEEINKNLPDAIEESDYYIEESNLIINKGKTGTKVDKDEFIKRIYEVIENKDIKEIEIPTQIVDPKEINIDEIYKEIHKEKKDAYIIEDPLEISPEVNGVDFEISINEAKELLNKSKQECIIPLRITIPDVTLEKLGEEAFPNKLGEFTTRYDASNVNRSTNIELASNKIDGTIILPGETFSYNKIVGQRTISQGYKEAAVYAGGQVVEGVGGGICQLSSTLYNAVLYANLEVTQRSNHQFMTSYVTAGRDATVSWGSLDFCFKNNRKYPIKVVSKSRNGVITVEIYGIKEEKEYEVVIETTVEEVIPLKTKYVKNSEMTEGEQKIIQKGLNGAKSKTYKTVKYNGIIISKEEISSDSYDALDRIIEIGEKETEEVNTNIESDEFAINAEELEGLNPELLNSIRELE